jgi:hypothetical protein
LQTSTSDIPDVLFLWVCIGSGLLWGNYLTCASRASISTRIRFEKPTRTILGISFCSSVGSNFAE